MIEIEAKDGNFVIPLNYIKYLMTYLESGYGKMIYKIVTQIGDLYVIEKEYKRIKEMFIKRSGDE